MLLYRTGLLFVRSEEPPPHNTASPSPLAASLFTSAHHYHPILFATMASESLILKSLIRENYGRLIEVMSQPETLNNLTSLFYEANLLPKELKDVVHHTVGLSARQKACRVLDAVEDISYNSLEKFLRFIRVLKSVGCTEELGANLLEQLKGNKSA